MVLLSQHQDTVSKDALERLTLTVTLMQMVFTLVNTNVKRMGWTFTLITEPTCVLKLAPIQCIPILSLVIACFSVLKVTMLKTPIGLVAPHAARLSLQTISQENASTNVQLPVKGLSDFLAITHAWGFAPLDTSPETILNDASNLQDVQQTAGLTPFQSTVFKDVPRIHCLLDTILTKHASQYVQKQELKTCLESLSTRNAFRLVDSGIPNRRMRTVIQEPVFSGVQLSNNCGQIRRIKYVSEHVQEGRFVITALKPA